MESTQIFKYFENLNNEEKQSYADGFKLAYNIIQIKNKNKTVNNLISTLLNYSNKSIPDNKEYSIQKSNELLKSKNKELLKKFETIIKICPQNKKAQLVDSLKQYLFFDKKYNDTFALFKKLKNDIKTNKDSNLWVNQIKYLKIVDYYKQKLQTAHDDLHKNISNMKDTNNIRTNIRKKKERNSTPIQEEVVEPVQEEVVEPVQEEVVEPVQEEVVEPVQEEVVEPVQEEVVEPVKPQKKPRKPRKKKEDNLESTPTKKGSRKLR
jgi:hypothetical protein